jgi:aminoglycoside 3-N-acetyltransferase
VIRTSLDQLGEHLRALKIPKYSSVIIHSSLFHFGVFEGGVAGFYAMIENVFDETYTLAMPAFNWGFTETKYWNYRTTKSQCGVLTEHMRMLPGTLRTIHPFHSLSVRGPEATALARSICSSSFGKGSAFEKLYDLNAYNLSLGSPFVGGATFCHHVEEALQVPYRFYKDFDGTVIDAAGDTVATRFSMYVRVIEQTYEYMNTWDVFWDDLMKHGLVNYTRFNDFAPVFVMNIRDAHDLLARRISRDPHYVAQKVSR